MIERVESRVDDAFKELSRTQADTARNTARLDGINGQIRRLGDEQQATHAKLTEQGDEMRDRFATVREDLKDVAVRTSLVCGVIVAVICSSVGAAGIMIVQHTVKSQLTPTQTTPAHPQQPIGV